MEAAAADAVAVDIVRTKLLAEIRRCNYSRNMLSNIDHLLISAWQFI